MAPRRSAMLRLTHIYPAGEHPSLSEPASVDLCLLCASCPLGISCHRRLSCLPARPLA